MTERAEHDFYPTPPSAVAPLLHEFSDVGLRPKRVLCPGSGDGLGVGYAVRNWRGPSAFIEGCEIDQTRAIDSLSTYDNVVLGDYLTTPHRFERPELIIMNPPFSLATEFITTAIERDSNMDTTVAVLARIDLLGAQSRHDWWRTLSYPPVLRVLSKRPSFTDGGTDKYNLAWFVFNLPILMRRSIDWYR